MTDYKKFEKPEEPINWSKMSGHIQIMNERNRHQILEGYSIEADQAWRSGELVSGAAAYLMQISIYWPEKWDIDMYKPAKDDSKEERIKELVKAGALIAAEIDRLLNSEPWTNKE